jgi:streptogramin lyase
MGRLRFTVIILIIFLFVFVQIPSSASAERDSSLLEEVDLYPAGSARGVYLTPIGSIFVLDLDDEVWKVDPETGSYFGYYGISGYELYDISPQDKDIVWWTDASQMFGSLNTNTGQITSWDTVDENDDYWGNLPQLGSLIYEDEVVWLSEWMGTYFGFLRFDVLTGEICSYDVPIHASDLILDGDYIWALDWFLDALLRLDPVTGQLAKYTTDGSIGLNANLQADGSLLWWAEDIEGGDIASFNPTTIEMTVYDLPDGEKPRNLSLFGGKIWYTNANGSFGRLDPNLISGTQTTLTQVILNDNITPLCKNLGPGLTSTATEDHDTSSWIDFSSTKTEIASGIFSYSLPEGSAPYGIAGTSSDIWIADPGRQKLIRMPISYSEFGYASYLPLIIK